jgi:hypothetical protein
MSGQSQILNQIFAYINGELSYNAGLSLFMKIPHDKDVLKSLFGLENPSKKEILIQNLKSYYHENSAKLVKAKHASAQPIDQNHSVPPTITESAKSNHSWSSNYRYTSANLAGETDSIKEHLHKERRRLYDLRKHLGSDLYNAVSDESRHQIAINILDICLDIDELHADLRRLELNQIPAKFIKKSRTAEEFVKMENARHYIRNYKRKIEKSTNTAEIERFKKLIEKHENNLKTLINE